MSRNMETYAEFMSKVEVKQRMEREQRRKKAEKEKKQYNSACFNIGREVLVVFPELYNSGSTEANSTSKMIDALTAYLLSHCDDVKAALNGM